MPVTRNNRQQQDSQQVARRCGGRYQWPLWAGRSRSRNADTAAWHSEAVR